MIGARRPVVGALLALVSFVPGAHAQSSGGSGPTLDDLRAPPAPAFVLLGIAPAKIARPDGVRPVVLSLLSLAQDPGFPRNYALEVAPYWLRTPDLSFDDYYAATPRNLWRQLSLSVATSSVTSEAAHGVALGVRTVPVPGRPHPALAALRADLAAAQRALAGLIGDAARRPRLIELLLAAQTAADKAVLAELESPAFQALIDEVERLERDAAVVEIEIDDLEADAAADAGRPPAERAARAAAREASLKELRGRLRGIRAGQSALAAKMIDTVQRSGAAGALATSGLLSALASRLEPAQTAAVERAERRLQTLALEIQGLDDRRLGWLLAIAAGAAWHVPTTPDRDVVRAETSVWVTPGYRWLACGAGDACTASLDVLAVARLSDRPGVGRQHEFGARVIWQPFRSFATSVEWLGRTRDPGGRPRLVAGADYRINDTMFLYASFGRDFRDAPAGRALVSIIGVTFGFGREPSVTPPVR